jgi:RNA polymerase sigma-70 factor (ECF subfamily)
MGNGGTRPGSEQALSDEAAMLAVQTGDGDALAALFDRYNRLVLSVALRILRDRGEAEDVTQNIFLEIFKSAGQFDPAKGTFLVWLMQYVYHRSISRKNYLLVRQFYSNAAFDDLTELDQGAMEFYTAPVQECSRFIREALALLNERQRRTIEMVHFEGLTLKDIAERTEEPYHNVRHHYYRGLASLKGHLKSVRPRLESGLDSGLEGNHAEA